MIDFYFGLERRFGRRVLWLVASAISIIIAIIGIVALIRAYQPKPGELGIGSSPAELYCGALPAACHPSRPPAVVAWSAHDDALRHYFEVIYKALPDVPPSVGALSCAYSTFVHGAADLRTSPPSGAPQTPRKDTNQKPTPSPTPTPTPTPGPNDAGFDRLAAVREMSASPSADSLATERVATHDLNETVSTAIVRLNGQAADQYARTLKELGPGRRGETIALHRRLLCYRRRLHQLAVLQVAWYDGHLRCRNQWMVESCTAKETTP